MECSEHWGAEASAINTERNERKPLTTSKRYKKNSKHGTIFENFPNPKVYNFSYYHDFLPVEQTFCTYPQWAGTPYSWSSQTARLPSPGIILTFLLSFVTTSRYSVKMTLCKPDSKYSSRSRMALQSFICTLDDLDWSLLWGLTLFKISSSFLA